MVVENEFSEAFINDLNKFKIWLDENEYYLNDIVTGEKVNLEVNMMSFNEPSRNKLECYVKELLKCYCLVKDNEDVDDIKTMIKNFRQNKPKKVKKDNKIKKEKQIENNIKKKENDVIKSAVNERKFDMVVKDNLDTKDVCYIDTLEFSTLDLEKVFGKPLKNGCENDKHQYEWKILAISGDEEMIYSIYNWKDENDEFKSYNENMWHIGTIKRCIKDNAFGCECNLSVVKKFIKEKLKLENSDDNKSKVNKQIKSKVEKIESKVLTEDNIMKLFNLTDLEPEIIDIDDICF